MTTAYDTLAWELSERVLTLRLNRPERLNAFTVRMADDLCSAFARASDDDQVGAVVVTGAGRAFCAGMDLSVGDNVFGLDESLSPVPDAAELRERRDEPALVRGLRDSGGRVALSIFACKKPVIAAINGAAIGVGATMTAAMDLRYASEDARIGFVFRRLGIVPEACSSWFLPRIVGVSQALEWCYSGEIVDAHAAQRAGFVKAVLPAERLLDEARAAAARCVAGASPVAVALTRQMMYRNMAARDPLEAHLIESLGVFHTSQRDGREGIRAFLEKRAPRFDQRASADMPPFYPWWDDA